MLPAVPGGHIWTALEGSHTLRAEVDDINRISTESNETNNRASRTITVGDYPGLLQLESRPAPGRVNLSAEGTLDWAHFGSWKGNGITSRKKHAGLIGEIKQVGNGYIDVNPGCHVSLAWNDGEGVAEQTDTHAGLWGNCVGNGFIFSVPADREERILRVYVSGSNGAHGKLSASLSDGSAPDISCDAWRGNRAQQWAAVPDEFSAVYIIRYRAAAEKQSMTVKWEMIDEPNRFIGQIRIQAATLSKP